MGILGFGAWTIFAYFTFSSRTAILGWNHKMLRLVKVTKQSYITFWPLIYYYQIRVRNTIPPPSISISFYCILNILYWIFQNIIHRLRKNTCYTYKWWHDNKMNTFKFSTHLRTKHCQIKKLCVCKVLISLSCILHVLLPCLPSVFHSMYIYVHMYGYLINT